MRTLPVDCPSSPKVREAQRMCSLVRLSLTSRARDLCATQYARELSRLHDRGPCRGGCLVTIGRRNVWLGTLQYAFALRALCGIRPTSAERCSSNAERKC